MEYWSETEILPIGAAGMKGKVNLTICLDGVLTKSEAHQSTPEAHKCSDFLLSKQTCFQSFVCQRIEDSYSFERILIMAIIQNVSF